MRVRVPVTIGLSFGISLALSAAVGSDGVTVLIFCAALTGGLAFGGWVLSTDDRTERLERLIRAFRGRSGRSAHGRAPKNNGQGKAAPKDIDPPD